MKYRCVSNLNVYIKN